MKNYKDLKELNKEWETCGFRINEKGELMFRFEDGKERKVGSLRQATEEEKKRADMIDAMEKKLKVRKRKLKI